MVLNGVGFSIDLRPGFRTSRTAIQIHPDGNVPGTLGCIGLNCGSEVFGFYNWAQRYMNRHGGEIPVQVNIP